MGTGLSFFDGVESAARYVGDSGKRREERVKVRAEKLKVKETEREIKQAERAERVKKRKEVFLSLIHIFGVILGTRALGGLIAGSLVTGVLMAIFMSNSGGAWDNACLLYTSGI